ncbi:MAG: SpoIID/LytB domain-containing protein [Planctomycetota bacterium]|nr:SpoIID/LytB domain-containing protein [Planctomycetota bacterium]MCX8040657.1 SpoIID/LytB domain-containing protein [Planctomycetota bacterium]MDW8372800.1 SpoIID/LytB domain-containing protein [Planctomycetota bacterium]
MDREQALRAVRAGLLLLLLLGALAALGVLLELEERERGRRRLPPPAGSDPGLRVLLLNRPQLHDRAPPRGARTFDALTVQALVDCELSSPDAPQDADKRILLRRGGRLLVRPELNSGLVLSSADFERGPKELLWTVSRVHLMPWTGIPAAQRSEPSSWEAPQRRPSFAIGRRRYRGSLELRWLGSKEVAAINFLPLEAYVEGVVGIEMQPGWPLEALKAQAIVSRSFAYARRARARAAQHWFDLTDGGEDQEYRGDVGNARCWRAAFETGGQVLTIAGQPFLALFHASSGGSVGGVEPVWPEARDVSGRLPLSGVMPAMDDPWCLPAVRALGWEETHGRSTATIHPRDLHRELGKLLAPSGRTIGYINDLKVGRRDPLSQRVLSVRVFHSQGEPIEIPAQVLRRVVGENLLRSTLWTPESPRKYESPSEPGRFLYDITCLGWGHGAGMSQVSAWLMARQGFSAERIVQRFYPGARAERLW